MSSIKRVVSNSSLDTEQSKKWEPETYKGDITGNTSEESPL